MPVVSQDAVQSGLLTRASPIAMKARAKPTTNPVVIAALRQPGASDFWDKDVDRMTGATDCGSYGLRTHTYLGLEVR